MTHTEGKTTIAPEVLLTIARLATSSIPGVSHLSPVPTAVKQRLIKRGHISEGVAIQILDDLVYADLYVVFKNDVNVRDVSRKIQHEVARAISEMVGMQVGKVNIHIEDIDYIEEAQA
jgi:uncharacterized alkaline shock family protein YloU